MKKTLLWILALFLLALPFALGAPPQLSSCFNDSKSNNTNQFVLYDDFNGAALSANWTNQGSIGTVSGGKLRYVSNDRTNNYIRSTIAVAPNMTFEFQQFGSLVTDMNSNFMGLANFAGGTDYFGDLGTDKNAVAFIGFSSSTTMDIMRDATSAAGLNNVALANAFPSAIGAVHNLSIYVNSTGGIHFWRNGTYLTSTIPGGADTTYYIHFTQNINSQIDIDSVRVYNGTSCPSPQTPQSPLNITFTAADLYDASSILIYSVAMYQGGTLRHNFSTTNGTIPVSNITNGFYNLTFQSDQAGGYFQSTYNNVNVSGQSFVGQLYQAIAYFNASELFTGNTITSFNASVPLQFNTSNSTGWTKFYLKAGDYNISGASAGYFNSTIPFSVSALSTNYFTIANFSTNRLRIDAKSIIDGSYISAFSIQISNGTYTSQKSTTTGNITFDVLAGTWIMNFSSPTHANQNASIVVSSSSIYPNYTFSVYTTNSVNISIFDEIIGKPSTFFYGRVVNLDFSSGVFAQNYTTNSSIFYVDLLTPSEYQIKYYSDTYTPRIYYFSLENRSNNQIDLYLLSTGNSTSTIINILDNTGNVLEDATVYLQRYYISTNSYKTVAMAKTNEEGQVVFNVEFNNPFYKIIVIYGEFMTVTNGAKIFQTTQTITVETESNPFNELDNIESISSYITFNNATQTFTLNAVNLEGTSLPFTLKVSKVDGMGTKTQVCSSSDTFSSGSVLCQYNLTLNEGSYIAEGFVSLDDYVPSVVIAAYQISLNSLQEQAENVFGRDGLLYSLIISGFFALIGAAAGPIGAMVGFVGGFGVSSLIGLVFFGNGGYTSLVVFISLIIAVGAISWRISR
jgi:hypothetical protein